MFGLQYIPHSIYISCFDVVCCLAGFFSPTAPKLVTNQMSPAAPTPERIAELAAKLRVAESHFSRVTDLVHEARAVQNRVSGNTSTEAPSVAVSTPVFIVLAAVAFVSAYAFGTLTGGHSA